MERKPALTRVPALLALATAAALLCAAPCLPTGDAPEHGLAGAAAAEHGFSNTPAHRLSNTPAHGLSITPAHGFSNTPSHGHTPAGAPTLEHAATGWAAGEGEPSDAIGDAVIRIDHGRDVGSIVDMARAHPHSAFDPARQTRYKEGDAPSLASPYRAGSLDPADILDAQNALIMVRYIAGLPYENVRFTDELNAISQHGAALLALYDRLAHSPPKPMGMDQGFYDIAFLGCSQANLSSGYTNISAALLGQVGDVGANNLSTADHRRWLLKPGGENFGIGYVKGADSLRNFGNRVSLYVYDGPSPGDCEADTFIAWPSAGDFPIQYFIENADVGSPMSRSISIPWSVNLGAAYQAPDKEGLTLTLTRSRGGVAVNAWRFDASTPSLGDADGADPGMHFAADNEGYGMGKAITFRPDIESLGRILDGDVFTVRVGGLTSAEPGKAGRPATLKYEIRFFDLRKEMARSTVTFIVSKGSMPAPGAKIQIAGQEVVAGEDGRASVRLGNHGNYGYAVEIDGEEVERGEVALGASSAAVEVSLPGESDANAARAARAAWADWADWGAWTARLARIARSAKLATEGGHPSKQGPQS